MDRSLGLPGSREAHRDSIQLSVSRGTRACLSRPTAGKPIGEAPERGARVSRGSPMSRTGAHCRLRAERQEVPTSRNRMETAHASRGIRASHTDSSQRRSTSRSAETATAVLVPPPLPRLPGRTHCPPRRPTVAMRELCRGRARRRTRDLATTGTPRLAVALGRFGQAQNNR